MNTSIPSRHAIIDVAASRSQVVLDRILKHGERVPVIITGYIVGGDDPDGESQEFAVAVTSARIGLPYVHSGPLAALWVRLLGWLRGAPQATSAAIRARGIEVRPWIGSIRQASSLGLLSGLPFMWASAARSTLS